MSATANATPDEEERRLEKLRKKFGANAMLMMSGIGVAFRGRNFKSESDRTAGIEMRTRWIVALWLPLIPLGTYRVRRSKRMASSGRTRYALELFSQEPLAWRQVFRWWSLTAAGIVLMLVVYYLS